MTMRASLIITAKDQANGVFARIAAGARRMGNAFKPVQKEAHAADAAIGKVGNGASARFARIGASARKMAGDMRIGQRAAYGLGVAIGTTIRMSARLGDKMLRMAATTAKWGAIAGAGAVGFGIGKLLTGAISTGAQFEQFEVMLKTVTGSAAAAKQSMAWVQKFAATTPYELDQVMASFVKLKTRGLDPTDGTLRSLGDAASAMGKDIDSAVEMMADAMTGEFERLKEFGVTANQKGDQVTFHWMKNGKAMSRSIKKDGAEIRKTLSEIFDSSYKGAMDAQSRTFSGMVSNLKDQWTSFQKMVADAGIFDLVKQKLAGILAWVGKAASDGRLKGWAESISAALEKAVSWAANLIEKTDWKKVGADLMTVGRGAWGIALALAKVVEWAQKAQPLLSALSMVADPVGPVRRALWRGVGALASDGSAGTPAAKMPGTGPQKRGARPMNVPAWQQGGKGPLRRGATSAPRMVPAAPKALPSRAPAPSRPQAANDVQVGGKVQIEVKAAPGTQVRTTQMSSANPRVPLNVRTGKAMAGAA